MSFTKLYFAAVLGFWVGAGAARGLDLGPAEKETLQTAHQGGVVLFKELWAHQRDVPALPVTISDDHGPQFLFSDKPEYFRAGNGIALQEDVKPGIVRLYLYHVPQPSNGPKTISAVIQNLGAKPMKLRLLRRAFPTPGKNYHRIAKTALMDFFDAKPEKSRPRIPPGARSVIDPQLDAATATTDDLVHGFYEFEIDQPARVTVFQREPGQSSLEAVDTLPKLPREARGQKADGAGRGLFLTSDLKVTGENGFILDTTNGAMRLSLADGRREHYILGHDSIDGINGVPDSGNYGVMYRIHLKWRSGDGRGLALLMTKRGGNSPYCFAQAGAVQVNRGAWPGGTVAIPTGQIFYGNPGEMVIIQKFPPPRKGRTGEIEILYSPPGASCIPTPMLLVPY